MAEQVRVAIDERGGVHVELRGYADRRCEVVEDELRRQLAELGLRVEVEGRRVKSTTELEAERRAKPGPEGPRRVDL
jgi:hypothetical protein